MDSPKVIPNLNKPRIGFTNSFIQDYSILNIVFPIYGACEYGEVELGESYIEMNYGQKPIITYKSLNPHVSVSFNKPTITLGKLYKPRVC